MEILNAYDLTGSYRAAAELCGCSHHTVKKAVDDRDAGLSPATRRARMIDDWRDVLEGWVSDSKGKIRGDKAHERAPCAGIHRNRPHHPPRAGRHQIPMATGQYTGAPTMDHRTRAVAAIRLRRRPDRRRAARSCCWWRGWRGADTGSSSRCGIGPHPVSSPDWTGSSASWAAPRPTCSPTTRRPSPPDTSPGSRSATAQAVTFGRYYGISVLTCQPADPASKGGVENAVKLAKADIVPTETNLLPQYATFADVETACSVFIAEINARVHRATGRRPGRDAHPGTHCAARRCPICRTPRPWA